jgi:glycosyltransferase involved in cell wall biosynthesis
MSALDFRATPILCIGMGWSPLASGGLNRYIYELTHQLAVQGNPIEFGGVGLPAQNSITGLHPLISLLPLAAADSPLLLRLWQIHSRFEQRTVSQPHAINLHFALYGFPLLTKLPKDVPLICTFHGPWAAESQQEGAGKLSILFKQWIEHQVYRRCDRFIVLSKAFGTILHETYGVSWEKIHIIPGGVDVDTFQPTLSREAARQQLNFPLDRPVLFTPRRLVQRMGLDKLLLALLQVKHQIPDVWLAIAGKGRLRESLEQQAKDLGLEDNVRFLGFIPDEQLPIAYQAADLTVVPSQSLEGFGLILLESMACGTPALCTPVGGMPEVILPFDRNLVTESSEPPAIADRLVTLLKGDLALPTREVCRDYAVANYDWRQISQRVREVLLKPIA